MNKYPSLIIFLVCAVAIVVYVFAGKFVALGLAVCGVLFAIALRNFLSICLAAGLCAGTLLSGIYAPVSFSNPDYICKAYKAVVVKTNVNSLNPELTLDIQGDEPFRALVKVHDSPFFIDEGDIIHFPAILHSADSVRDVPYVSFRRLSLLAGRISAVGSVAGNDISVIGTDNAWVYRLRRFTLSITEGFERSSLTENNRKLLAAAFFGKDFASEEQLEKFSSIGLVHLLCVSGFHVGLVAILLNLILFPLKASDRLRKLRYSLFIAGIWVFVGLCGFEPSAVRAAGMLSAFAFCLATDRSHNPLNALGFGALIVLVINPYWLFSIGFQLSVTATAGIISMYMLLPQVHSRSELRSRKILSLVSIPLFALLFSGPLLILYFHRIPVTSIVASAVGSVIFTAFVFFGGLSVCMGMLGIGGQWVSVPANWLGSLMDNLCDNLGGLEAYVDYSLFPSPLQTLLLLCSICTGVWALNCHGKGRLALSGISLIAVFFIPFTGDNARNCVILTGKAVLCINNGEGELIHFTDNPYTDYIPFFQGNGVGKITRTRRMHGYFTVGNGAGILRLTGSRQDVSVLSSSEAHIAFFTESAKSNFLSGNFPGSLRYIVVAAFMPAEEKLCFRRLARERGINFIDLAQHRVVVIDLLY